MKRWFQLLILSLLVSQMSAADLVLKWQMSSSGQRWTLGAWRHHDAAGTPFAVSRLSFLVSEVAVHTEKGWHPLEGFGWIDVEKQRYAMRCSGVPESAAMDGIRFSIGISKKLNHGDPSQYAADHPLNPVLNRMHWDWKSGYLFVAFEGHYGEEKNGFVYHFANDPNKIEIELALPQKIRGNAEVRLDFGMAKWMKGLAFSKDGDSTHSPKGDPISATLKANLGDAFSVVAIRQSQIPEVAAKPVPIDLPDRVTPHPFKMSRRFPKPPLPLDNPLIEERVTLGKRLFFDPVLSRDGTVSCSSCHIPSVAFADPRTLSQGINGNKSLRHSMPLFNLAWKSSFFWDGRANSLREQVLHPIQDPLEMGETLENIETKLAADPTYREAFAKAFGSGDITVENLALSLENYLLTLTSHDSKFDRALAGKANLTQEEKRGFELFITEYEPRSRQFGADCFHCHGGALMTDHGFHNNGLHEETDLGLMVKTGKEGDRARFSTPSLRNVALTAPYMHDGRFATLEEVVAHYSGPMHASDSLDPNLAKHPRGGLQLSEEDQKALVAFLKALTDPQYADD